VSPDQKRSLALGREAEPFFLSGGEKRNTKRPGRRAGESSPSSPGSKGFRGRSAFLEKKEFESGKGGEVNKSLLSKRRVKRGENK